MKQKKQNIKQKNIVEPPTTQNRDLLDFTPYIFLLLFVFLVPIFPDEKLTRLKLLVLESCLFFATVSLLIRMVYKNKILILNHLTTGPLLIYFLYILILYLTSADRPAAVSEFTRNILCLTAFFTVSNTIESKPDLKRLVNLWILSAVLVSIYGIAQHNGGISFSSRMKLEVPHFERIMSTFGNPIFFAVYIVTTLPLIISNFLLSKKGVTKFLLFLSFTILLWALYLTATRAAWIAAFVSLTIYAYISLKTKFQKYVFILTLLVLSTVFGWLTRNVWLRFQEHTLIWRDTITMWTKYPLTGVGLGTFHLYFPKHASEQLKKIFPQEKFIVNDAHNEFIQTLAESGIIGFLLFTTIFVTYFITVYRWYRLKPTDDKIFLEKDVKENVVWLTGMFCSTTAILIQNFFSVDMRFIISSVYLFFTMGLSVSLYKHQTKNFSFSIPKNLSYLLFLLIITFSYFSGKEIIKPYLAQHKVATTPDFFEEKLNDPNAQISELLQLSNQHPTDARVYEKLAWVYAKQKMFGQAIEAYRAALKIVPTSSAFNNLGNIYFLSMGNKDLAIECYNNSLTINQNQIDARLNLGVAYYYKGKLKEAADQFKKVLELDPNNEKAIVYYKRMVE